LRLCRKFWIPDTLTSVGLSFGQLFAATPNRKPSDAASTVNKVSSRANGNIYGINDFYEINDFYAFYGFSISAVTAMFKLRKKERVGRPTLYQIM